MGCKTDTTRPRTRSIFVCRGVRGSIAYTHHDDSLEARARALGGARCTTGRRSRSSDAATTTTMLRYASKPLFPCSLQARDELRLSGTGIDPRPTGDRKRDGGTRRFPRIDHRSAPLERTHAPRWQLHPGGVAPPGTLRGQGDVQHVPPATPVHESCTDQRRQVGRRGRCADAPRRVPPRHLFH